MKSFQEFMTEAKSVTNIEISKLIINPSRQNNFKRYMEKGIPFELNAGGTIIIPNSPHNKDLISKIENDSVKRGSKFKDENDNDIAWSWLKKTADFGGQGSSPDPSGAEWEMLICAGLENHVSKGKVNINKPVYAKIKKFWDDYEDVATKIGADFGSKFNIKHLEQTGATPTPLNPQWGTWGGSDKTPKTDMMSKKIKISLKKSGGSQLMSAKKGEAIATFNAAMVYISENESKIVKDMIDVLSDGMKDMKFKDAITSVKALDKKKNLTPKELEKLDQVKKQTKVHEDITMKLNELFSDQKFKNAFCFEAASGRVKFSDTVGTANQIVVFDIAKGKILYADPLTNVMKDGAKLAKGNNFYVAFKKSGGAPHSSLRSGKTMRTYNESISSFEEIIREETKDFGYLLNEEIGTLDEGQMFNKLKSMTKQYTGKVGETINRIFKKIMERIDATFVVIKKLGSQMLEALLSFFKLDISKVTIKSGGKYPL